MHTANEDERRIKLRMSQNPVATIFIAERHSARLFVTAHEERRERDRIGERLLPLIHAIHT